MSKEPTKAESNWVIRKARHQDVNSLLSLSRRVTDNCSREFLDDSVVDRFINSGACDSEVTDNLDSMHVLLDADRIIGFCVWQDNCLKSLMTDVDYHGTGAAVFFLTQMTQTMLTRHEKLYLECFDTNSRALAFYQKLGWEYYKTVPDPQLNVNSLFYCMTRARQENLANVSLNAKRTSRSE